MTKSHYVDQAGHCPNCAILLDGATGEDADRPLPGDLTVCGYCGTLLRFGPSLGLERLSDHDMAVLEHEEPQGIGQLKRMQAFILARIRYRAGGRA